MMENNAEFSLEMMEQETDEMLSLRYITDENATFSETTGGFMSMKFYDEKYDRVEIYLTFPFTEPDLYVSIRTPDEKAKEIGIIKDLKQLSPKTQEILKKQIKYRYFTPKIKRVYSVKTEYGFAYFDVLTDSGKCRFVIRMNGGAVVSLTETRVIIFDLDGNRFEIEDITKLSSKERKQLDLFI